MRRFRTYDRAVDVVSAFEYLFTSVDSLKKTVSHFERFPTVFLDNDSTRYTPDFTVVFNDATALMGEIARVALHENSVDKVCKQLSAYDQAKKVAVPGAGSLDVGRADVLLLVPSNVGPDAARRVIKDRYFNPDHEFSPSAAPCVMQFLFDEGSYSFQPLMIDGNGIPDDGSRSDGLGRWLRSSSQVNIPPQFFAGIKSERPFINDDPEPLYLAVLLWTKFLPTKAGPLHLGEALLEFTTEELTAEVKARFGPIRATHIKAMLTLLTTAGLARLSEGIWQLGWQRLRRERDIARAIASYACKPSGSPPIDRLLPKPQKSDRGLPMSLFESEDHLIPAKAALEKPPQPLALPPGSNE